MMPSQGHNDQENGGRVRKPSRPEQRVILKKVQAAGWRVQTTHDGWRLLSPDGKRSIVMHSSSSDHRALKNTYSHLKQAGLDLASR